MVGRGENRNNPVSDSPQPPPPTHTHTLLTSHFFPPNYPQLLATPLLTRHTSHPLKKLNQGFEKHTVSLIIQALVGLNSLFSVEIYSLLI